MSEVGGGDRHCERGPCMRACVHACERCVARTRSRGVATPCSLATWPRVPGDSGRPYGSTFPTASVTATRRPGGRREQFFTSHHAPREHASTPGADTGRTLGRRTHSNSLTHALTLSLALTLHRHKSAARSARGAASPEARQQLLHHGSTRPWPEPLSAYWVHLVAAIGDINHAQPFD